MQTEILESAICGDELEHQPTRALLLTLSPVAAISEIDKAVTEMGRALRAQTTKANRTRLPEIAEYEVGWRARQPWSVVVYTITSIPTHTHTDTIRL